MDIRVAEQVREGAVGVLPTDTLYGLVASAAQEQAVARVYTLKGRSRDKACIVLIGSIEDIATLGVEVTPTIRQVLERYWPGPTSIALPAGSATPHYLHCGTGSLAFRLPASEELRAFLIASGPIIAPSANPENGAVATTVDEAKAYFGEGADFYIDGGVLEGAPSTLLRVDALGLVEVLRKGR